MTVNSLSKIKYLTGRHLSKFIIYRWGSLFCRVECSVVVVLLFCSSCCYCFYCSLDKTNPHKNIKLSFLYSNHFFGLFVDVTVMYVPSKHYLTTESVRILNCELNSYRLSEEISCGSPNFSRFSLLLSVHRPQKL